MLKEKTLFGVEDKVKDAVELLRAYEPQDGYYLAFSGGKDSLCCYWLCKLAGVKFDAHYQYTSVDPPEIVAFVRTFEDVTIHHPGKDRTMWALIVQKGMPPTRHIRYCCSALKENKYNRRMKILGVREEESAKRKGRKLVYLDSLFGPTMNLIYRWTEADVWEFITCNLIDYCSLYDEGFARLGCVGCPLSSPRNREREFERWPAYRRAYVRTFERMLRERERRGNPSAYWKTGEDVMHDWLYGMQRHKGQLQLDFSTEEKSDEKGDTKDVNK